MQCAGLGQRREELRGELQLFAARLRREVVLPALEEHLRQLRSELLQPALAELRAQVRQDLVQELGGHRPPPPAAAQLAAAEVVEAKGEFHRPLTYRGTIHELTNRRLKQVSVKESPVVAHMEGGSDSDGCAGTSDDSETECNHMTSQPPRPSVKRYSRFVDRDVALQAVRAAHASGLSVRARTLATVQHWAFDYIVSAIIALNAIIVGLEADYLAKNPGGDFALFRFIDLAFCLFFVGELALRAFAHRGDLLSPSVRGWTIFDIAVVAVQAVDVFLQFVNRMVPFTNVSFVRLVRFFRLLRTSRLGRLLHLLVELRSMLSSIVGSMRSLFWVVVLYFVLVFGAGTFFTQAVAEHRIDEGLPSPRELRGAHAASSAASSGLDVQMQLDLYYGSIGSCILCLWEAISGGMDWKSMVDPLFDGVNWLVALMFLFYIVFATVAMMNVVTGIFVEHAMRHAEEDQDIYVAKNVIGFFRQSDLGSDGEITMNTWEEKMDCPEMQALFRAVNVDPSDARSLFRLIDLNDSGTLDPDELIDGWVRLRGQAKSLDLALLMRETDRANQSMQKSLRNIQETLSWMCTTLVDMPAHMESAVAVGLARQGTAVGSTDGSGGGGGGGGGGGDGSESGTLAEQLQVPSRRKLRQLTVPSPSPPNTAWQEAEDKPFRSAIRPLRRSVVKT